MLFRHRHTFASRLSTTAVALGALGLTAVAVSQDDLDFPVPDVKPAEHQIAPAFDPGDMNMEAWMQASSPGEHHEMLSEMVGDWDVVVKMWMGGADSGMPTVSEATAKVTMVLDGRHLREEFKGVMMGQPFEGVSTTSYDNYSGQYVTHWVDSMSTAPGVMRGHASMDGGSIIFYGSMDEPMMGMRGKTIKAVTRMVDEKTHVFEMHDMHIEGDTKVMEMTYTRKNDD